MRADEELTRDEARALIAEYKVESLERNDGRTVYGEPYEPDHFVVLVLGNGQRIRRDDCGEEHGEAWYLMHTVIATTASEIDGSGYTRGNF